jgi:dynein heavy chain
MDVQGWYDLETKEFKHLQDIVFVAAMLPPQGGRNVVTLRYLRHYVMQYAQPFDNDSLNRIFGTVVEWFLMNLGASQAVPKSVTTIAN